jgi:hypothetical protein
MAVRGAVVFALRRMLAALVLIGGVVVVVAILDYRESTGNLSPWWAIPVAITVGMFALALSVLIYPRRARWPLSGRGRLRLGGPGSRPPLA